MIGLDWLLIVLLLLVVYLLWCCHKVSKWIKDHELWFDTHHERNGRLEKAVCQLEDYVYRHPLDPSLIPDPSKRFCVTPNTPPDGWGGSKAPDGF